MENLTVILEAGKSWDTVNNGSTHHTPDINLFPALVECFFIILLGYGAGRLDFISPTAGKGIGVFLSHVSLPALLLKSMAELDLSKVNWNFMASILIAKGTVFVIVVMFSLLLLKPLNYGRAGIFAIFATQSNDFALGYPVLKAIYKDSHPNYVNYIYLLAPISLVCLSPIGYFMMEYQRQKSTEGHQIHKLRILSKTLKGLVTNPIVFMTIAGLIYGRVSDSFRHKAPLSYIDGILEKLSSAFFATALFYLGFKMVGNMKKNVGFGLIVPLLLIFAKTLLLPLIAREVIVHLDVGKDKKDIDSWSMLGFLYGTFPSAPTVLVIAAKYGFEEETMATGLVICTLLAAPIMFTSAQMAQHYNAETVNNELVQETLFDTSCVAIPCAIWVFVVFLLGRRFKEKPHNFTLCLLLCQFLLALSGVLSEIPVTSKSWQFIQLILFLWSFLGSRCWTGLVALGLCLVRCDRRSRLEQWNGFIYILGWGVPTMCCGVVLIADGDLTQPPGSRFKQTFISYLLCKMSVVVTSIVVVVGSLCMTVVCLVRLKLCDQYCKCPDTLKKSKRTIGKDSFMESECSKDRCGRCQEISKEIAEEQSQSECEISKGIDDSCAAGAGPSKGSVLDIENLDESTCLLQKSSTSLNRSYSQDSFVVLSTIESELEGEYFYGQKHQLGRHVTLLLLLAISACLGMFICVWRLFDEPKEGGIYTTLEILDAVLLFGQSFMVFACFGFEKQLVIIPFVRRVRRLINGRDELSLPPEEDLGADVIHQCDQFKRYHKQRCQRALVGERRCSFGVSAKVVRGDQLVDWMLEVGLAADRQAAVHYGKSLVLGRVIEHVAKVHHFHDLPYFYKFCS